MMFDPFAGRHPPPVKPPLPQIGLKVLAPRKCPRCRRNLMSRWWLPKWVKWCRQCHWTVSYSLLDEEDV